METVFPSGVVIFSYRPEIEDEPYTASPGGSGGVTLWCYFNPPNERQGRWFPTMEALLSWVRTDQMNGEEIADALAKNGTADDTPEGSTGAVQYWIEIPGERGAPDA